MGGIGLDQDRRVNETRCSEIAWKRGHHAHALEQAAMAASPGGSKKCGTVDRREYT